MSENKKNKLRRKPPQTLYMWVNNNDKLSVINEGLPKGVELFEDLKTGIKNKPKDGYTAISVNSRDLYADKFTFYLVDESYWVTKEIPPKYLENVL